MLGHLSLLGVIILRGNLRILGRCLRLRGRAILESALVEYGSLNLRRQRLRVDQSGVVVAVLLLVEGLITLSKLLPLELKLSTIPLLRTMVGRQRERRWWLLSR